MKFSLPMRFLFTLGGATNYTYDDMGRLTSESTMSGGTVTYTYNALHLKSQLTNARGQARNFTYDVMGRITGCTDPDDFTALQMRFFVIKVIIFI